MKKKKLNQKVLVVLIIIGIISTIAIVIALNLIPTKYPENEEFWFANLPEKPNDFIMYKRDVEKGAILDLCPLEEEYWKQPEFSPTWERAKQSHYVGHDYSRWGVHGYGSYPADMGLVIRNLKQWEEIEICTFFKTSYGIETYQGIKLVPTEDEYFKVEISPQEFSEYPNHFLMTPTFPQFSPEWIRKVKLKITAKQDVPVGIYNLGFSVVSPDDRFNNKMVWEILMQDTNKDIEYVKKCVESIKDSAHQKANTDCETFMMERQKKYVSGGGWSIGRDTYSLTIEIVE